MKQFALVVSLVLIATIVVGQDSHATFKEELDKFRAGMQKQMPATAWEEGERIGQNMYDSVVARGGMDKILKVGEKAPSFTLNDAFGKPVEIKSLLKKGPVVLVFYRGAWCPFCNLYLRSIQKRLPEIEAHNATLVAVTTAKPDLEFEKTKLNYTVLSDPQNKVSKQFGLAYTLTKEMDTYYKKFGKDLTQDYSTEKPELLMSAVYIVDKKGVIQYQKAEPAYKNWAEPTSIIEVLAKLNM